MKITLISKNQKEIIVEGNVGERLMDVIERSGVPLILPCGGAGVCGGCKVVVNAADKLDVAGESEADMLDELNLPESTRLCCQARLTSDSDGLVVYLS
ncbi:MAG: (2Fe-2S)-binding protein [Holosporales bacterium]|jgi:ferredoxin|nr:(2Fe-2S)-binding protein [Holosporales bacterium]